MEALIGAICVGLLFLIFGLFIYHDSQIQKATYDDI